MKHFKLSEFDCPCCGENHMQDVVLEAFDDARDMAGVPFTINSGYRCMAHNLDKKVGGKPTSSHPKGWAADIEAITSRNRYLILEALMAANFHRIGIGKTFIHADQDPGKDPEVAWLY